MDIKCTFFLERKYQRKLSEIATREAHLQLADVHAISMAFRGQFNRIEIAKHRLICQPTIRQRFRIASAPKKQLTKGFCGIDTDSTSIIWCWTIQPRAKKGTPHIVFPSDVEGFSSAN